MRVLVAGDSWTSGYGVESQQTWNNYLPKHWDVTNVGEPGAGNRNIASNIRHYFDDHDLIIVGWSSPGRIDECEIEVHYRPEASMELQAKRLEYFETVTSDTLRKNFSKYILEIEGLPCKVIHFSVFDDSLPVEVKHSVDISYMEYLANLAGYEFLLDIPMWEYDYLHKDNVDIVKNIARNSGWSADWELACFERELPKIHIERNQYQLECGHPSVLGHEKWGMKIVGLIEERSITTESEFTGFDNYNFISCVYQGKEVIFWNNQQKLTETFHYTWDAEDSPAEDPQPDSSYDIMKAGIGFDDDTMIVCQQGHRYVEGVDKVINYINDVGPKKVLYFNDDAHTRWFIDEPTPKGVTMDLTKSPEGSTISDIVRGVDIPYHVYDCEYGALDHYTGIPAKKYGYYDIFTMTFYPTNVKQMDEIIEEHTQAGFQYNVCCTNKRQQVHRLLACVYLIDSPHLVKLTHYHKPRQRDMHCMSYLSGMISNPDKPNTLPTFQLLSEEMQKNLNDKWMLFTFADLTWDEKSEHDITGFSQMNTMKIVSDSFLSLVAETLWDTDEPFWSEKTLKPILLLRPFILLSTPGTLKLLRKLGFKTFGKFWDESYDLEKNSGKRFEMVMKIVDVIREKTIPELEVMLKEMQSILIHNRKQVKKLHTKNIQNA